MEHVLEPITLLHKCYELCHINGIMVIEVPNDFSVLQKTISDKKYIEENFWIVNPDHISYFNKDGLIKICIESNWKHLKTLGNFPIDFNLFNEESNYVNERSKGEGAHKARIQIDNMLHSISVEKTNNLYEALANLGLGRQIISFFQK